MGREGGSHRDVWSSATQYPSDRGNGLAHDPDRNTTSFLIRLQQITI